MTQDANDNKTFYVGKDCPYFDWPVDGEEHRITEVVVNSFSGELIGIFGPFNDFYTSVNDKDVSKNNANNKQNVQQDIV